MITSSCVVFKVIFGNLYFFLLVFKTQGRKKRFSASSQSSIYEKMIFSHFRVMFLYVSIFLQGGGDYFLLGHSQRSFLSKR